MELERSRKGLEKLCSACSLPAPLEATDCPHCSAQFLSGAASEYELTRCKKCQGLFDPSVRFCPRCATDSRPHLAPISLGCVLVTLVFIILGLAFFGFLSLIADGPAFLFFSRFIVAVLVTGLVVLIAVWRRRGAR